MRHQSDQPFPEYGRRRQELIFVHGLGHKVSPVPADFPALEEHARRLMTKRGFAYVAGGAGNEQTMVANRAAFDRWRIVPSCEDLVQGQSEPTTDPVKPPNNLFSFGARLNQIRRHPGSLLRNLLSVAPIAAVPKILNICSRASLTWKDLAWLRSRPACRSY